MEAAAGFSSVPDVASDCQCPDNARPSCEPLVLFNTVLLQFLYDLSYRQMEQQVDLYLACKWFVGLEPQEFAPDHRALCRFRARMGPDKFQAIFNQIVAQAREAGLVHDRLRMIDATADSELIAAVEVTPGNVADSDVFQPLVGCCADERWRGGRTRGWVFGYCAWTQAAGGEVSKTAGNEHAPRPWGAEMALRR